MDYTHIKKRVCIEITHTFMSGNKGSRPMLAQGLQGTVVQVDEDGDVRVLFVGDAGKHWILKKNLDKIRVPYPHMKENAFIWLVKDIKSKYSKSSMKEGSHGRVVSIDEDGDALLDLVGYENTHSVLKEDFDKIQPVEGLVRSLREQKQSLEDQLRSTGKEHEAANKRLEEQLAGKKKELQEKTEQLLHQQQSLEAAAHTFFEEQLARANTELQEKSEQLRMANSILLRLTSLLEEHPELSQLASMDEFSNELKAVQGIATSADTDEVKAIVVDEVAQLRGKGASADELAEMRRVACPVQLRSIEMLLQQMTQQLAQNPKFSQAVGGESLCQRLQDILLEANNGPFGIEEELFQRSIAAYVQRPMEELNKDDETAAFLVNDFDQVEEKLTSEMRRHSEILSSSEYSARRREQLKKRVDTAQTLLNSLDARMDAVRLRDSPAARLSEWASDFDALDAERRQSYEKEADRQQALADTIANIRARLQTYAGSLAEGVTEQTGRYFLELPHREKELNTALLDLQDAQKKIVHVLSEERRERLALCSAKVKAAKAQDVAESVDIELKVVQDMHMNMHVRWLKGAALANKFAEWIQAAYSGMHRKTADTMNELLRELPHNLAKYRMLSDAVLQDLQEQRSKLIAAQALTYQHAKQKESELSRLEFAGVGEHAIAPLQSEYEQLQLELTWQEKEIEAISKQACDLVSDRKRYEEKAASESILSLPEPVELQDWVSSWFFTRARQGVTLPRSLQQSSLCPALACTDTCSVAALTAGLESDNDQCSINSFAIVESLSLPAARS